MQPSPVQTAGIRLICTLVSASLVGTSCTTPYQKGLPPGMVGRTPPAAVAGEFQRLEKEGERDWVLNLDRLATSSLRNGEPEFAAKALDEATLMIDAIFTDNPAAERARSIWFSESSKIFKGEPYERTMSFLYRGILYMQVGDYENARASFRSAALQDSFAEEEQDRADWVSPELLAASCQYALGGASYGDEGVERAKKTIDEVAPRTQQILGPGMALAAPLDDSSIPTANSNLLVVVMAGSGPRKVQAGNYGEALAIEPGGGGTHKVEVFLDGRRLGFAPAVDSLSYQAMTRGGRAIDKILKHKAVYRAAGEGVGQGAMISGLVVASEASHHRGKDADAMVIIGLLVAAVGGGIYLLAQLVTPEADVRAWETLPESVHLLFARIEPGEHRVRVGGGPDQRIDAPNQGKGLSVVLVP